MYRTILVPLDGSIFGEHALPVAINIARRLGATLHVAHVKMPDLSRLADLPADQPLDAALHDAALAYLNGVAARITTAWGGPVATALLDGIVPTALHAYAADVGIDLVVLTTHGRGGIVRAWLGSTVDTLVRSLPIPLLLVRPQPTPPDMTAAVVFQHLLVPLDGSPLAEQILEPALALCAGTRIRLTVLRAVEPLALEFLAGGSDMGAIARAQEAAEAEAQRYLEQVAVRLRSPDVTVHTHLEAAAAVPALLGYADTQRVDLIALATRGRGGFARLTLGSTADKVARGAALPVLLYHPAAPGAATDTQQSRALEAQGR